MQATLQPTGIAKESAAIPQAAVRNLAIDTYRGLVMLLMMAEVLELSRVARAFPGNWFWGFLAYNQTHVQWAGCSLHDTIQPGFSFLVGVALPYSIASRMAKGGTFGKMFSHALWRSLLLIALGIFLRSIQSSQTYFTFEDTLTPDRTGLSVPVPAGLAAAALAVDRAGRDPDGYWLAWALYPVPALDSTAAWGAAMAALHRLRRALEQERQPGQRLRPVVPEPVSARLRRSSPTSGGYLTLSFIPTLGTMILGLLPGSWLRAAAPRIPMKRLLAAGAIGIAAGCCCTSPASARWSSASGRPVGRYSAAASASCSWRLSAG